MSQSADASDVPQHHQARLLIVEDHAIVRDGLVQVIDSTAQFTVAAAVGSHREARRALATEPIDLILLDLMIGAEDSLMFIAEVVAQRPTVKILVLSAMSQSIYAERTLRAGSSGYIMKSAETSELLIAIHSVLEGRVYLCPKIFLSLFRGVLHRSSAAKMPGAEGLSDRELQIFQLIGSGVQNREIAGKLSISVKTVETHRENLKLKLGLSNSTELAAAAQKFVSGLVSA